MRHVFNKNVLKVLKTILAGPLMTGLIKWVMCQNEIEKNDWETVSFLALKEKTFSIIYIFINCFACCCCIHASRNLLNLMRWHHQALRKSLVSVRTQTIWNNDIRYLKACLQQKCFKKFLVSVKKNVEKNWEMWQLSSYKRK